MAAILNFTIMNLAILDSAILVFPLKLTHTCQDWFPPFVHKKNFTHSFWLNLMMAAILNTAMLDSDTLLSSVRFTQKHSNCTLTLTQTQFNLINLLMAAILYSAILDSDILHKNFTHSLSPNLMMAAILNSAMLDSATPILDSNILLSSLRFTQKHSHSTPTLNQANSNWLKLIHSHLTWGWQPSWISPSWIWPS